MNKLLKNCLLIFFLFLCITGCSKSESSKVDTVIEENTSRTTVSGEFTEEVRDVIPDYCFDDVTSCVALVTEFQSKRLK